MWWFRRPTKITEVYLLVAGQSNASGRGRLAGKESSDHRVWMFGNDYQRKIAYEPVDDATNQVDAVSNDSWVPASTYGHSFALRAGKSIAGNMQRGRVVLIPCAKGGTAIAQWMPLADRYDRSTLYGSANTRHDTALPTNKALDALLYYGHESNAGGSRATYASDWSALIAEFRADWGASLPVIFCQLAKHTDPTIANQQHLTADIQRRSESGSGDATSIANTHMVVTFDLPLEDVIHLDQSALLTLGDRIALAVREHVLHHDVDGTGPRLSGNPIHPGSDKSKIKIDTTQALSSISNNADNQFRVFDDATEMTVASVERDPTDDSAIRITMSATAAGVVTVSYGDIHASATGISYANVIKNTVGLPLPQFGIISVV